MDSSTLNKIAKAILAPGKGLLAMDESTSTCKKRFDAYSIECTEENRREYREMLLTAEGLEQFISGAILYDETIRQKTKNDGAFTDVLKKKGILVGIKVDTGAKEMALHAGEKITEGLDGLRERLVEYKTFGAEFAKWRAVITIGPDMPSRACIKSNAHALARYAALCQEASIVPVVEPEVLMEGDYDISRCFDVTSDLLKIVFEELYEQGVSMEGTVLKASMVLSGKQCLAQVDRDKVAQQTLKCLQQNVPANLAGVVFLSGGQTDEKATAHLDAMNRIAQGKLPWPLSFSYGRALQAAALKIWATQKDTSRAQGVLVRRCELNSLATKGKYEDVLEKEVG